MPVFWTMARMPAADCAVPVIMLDRSNEPALTLMLPPVATRATDRAVADAARAALARHHRPPHQPTAAAAALPPVSRPSHPLHPSRRCRPSRCRSSRCRCWPRSTRRHWSPRRRAPPATGRLGDCATSAARRRGCAARARSCTARRGARTGVAATAGRRRAAGGRAAGARRRAGGRAARAGCRARGRTASVGRGVGRRSGRAVPVPVPAPPFAVEAPPVAPLPLVEPVPAPPAPPALVLAPSPRSLPPLPPLPPSPPTALLPPSVEAGSLGAVAVALAAGVCVRGRLLTRKRRTAV